MVKSVRHSTLLRNHRPPITLFGCNLPAFSREDVPTGTWHHNGAPVLVVVANLVMEDIKERELSTFHPSPHFWKRYADDTCAALPPDQIPPFLDNPNSIELCVQFMMEEESDGRLAFLDVHLSRNDDGPVCTSVYRKATHTNHYLAFESH